MKNTCPFYIVFQVLNIHLIKICKIVELPDLLFLVVFISFYSSRYHFHKFLELHSEIIRKNHQKHWTSPSGHNCQQKTLCHISTTFPNCQNYRLGHVEKIKSAIIKANHEVSCQCLSRGCTQCLWHKEEMQLWSIYRAEPKEQDPSIQGYVKSPAILMIKRTGERKYSLEKEFWTRFFTFELQIFQNILVLWYW